MVSFTDHYNAISIDRLPSKTKIGKGSWCFINSFKEKVLAFILKVDLVFSHQSLAEEWLFCVFNEQNKFCLAIVIFSWVVEFLDNILAFSLKRNCSGFYVKVPPLKKILEFQDWKKAAKLIQKRKLQTRN